MSNKNTNSETVWVSHSAITNFDYCKRLYYFKHLYKNPKTGNRIQIVNPYLSLGSAVHDTIDNILDLPFSKRTKVSFSSEFQKTWKQYSGKRGGFVSPLQEKEFKKKGVEMVKKVENADFLKRKALKKEKNLPQTTLFKNVKLVGCFDWVEILPDGLHVIDFKTGKKEESSSSLQLPIYRILANKNYDLKVKKTSYWYLRKDPVPVPQKMKTIKESLTIIKEKASEIQKTIDEKNFFCSSRYSRCFWCRTYESVFSGKAEFVGVDERMGRDLFYLPSGANVLKKIKESNFLTELDKSILDARLGEISEADLKGEHKLTDKKVKNQIGEIKKKIKNNLSSQELKFFIRELENNGKKLLGD